MVLKVCNFLISHDLGDYNWKKDCQDDDDMIDYKASDK